MATMKGPHRLPDFSVVVWIKKNENFGAVRSEVLAAAGADVHGRGLSAALFARASSVRQTPNHGPVPPSTHQESPDQEPARSQDVACTGASVMAAPKPHHCDIGPHGQQCDSTT